MRKEKPKSDLQLLREFAEKNNCDAVMLSDGTIKKYEGERYYAMALYKVIDHRYLEWR